jgi:hypothetical protein
VSIYPDISGPTLESDPLLAQLLEQLRTRHHDAICGALVYGSCLRSGDIYDGLLDLYLICDNYRAAYGRAIPAAANWLLPPNVFYAESKLDGKVLRSKVTVISLRDFQRGCSRTRFESYIWGRFAQPTRILFSRDDISRARIEDCLLQAARTLLRNAVPALPAQGDLTTLWAQALELSYATELRSERNGRAAELAQYSRQFYATMTEYHTKSLGFPFTVHDDGPEPAYASTVSPFRRRLCQLAWLLRRVQGKLLSVLRLGKALFTFEGGLDYIAWKLERHTGQEVVIPDRVRRAPLLYLWGFSWGLYRRGIFK